MEPKRPRLFGRPVPARWRQAGVFSPGGIGHRRSKFTMMMQPPPCLRVYRLRSWRATKMTAFIPITIYLNHRPMVVASIAAAAKALQQPWPSMDKPSRLEAIRMIEECLAGHCSHQAAYAAFEAAASEQGLLERKPPSVGLKRLDRVAEDLM
ncbi:DUF982 domain-containing protein [Mesorhizobium robiniae]